MHPVTCKTEIEVICGFQVDERHAGLGSVCVVDVVTAGVVTWLVVAGSVK